MKYLKIGVASSRSQDYALTNLFIAPNLFLMLVGVKLPITHTSFGSVFPNVRHFEWTMDACDEWNAEDKDFSREVYIQYPRSLQSLMLRELHTATAIEKFRITIEEDVILDGIHTFTTYLANVISDVHVVGSTKHLIQFMNALPSTLQANTLHLGTWDYWMPEDYAEILGEVARITGSRDETSPTLDIFIDNMAIDLQGWTFDVEGLDRQFIEEGSYRDMFPILQQINGVNL
jgi:hypothetical protein